MSAIANNWEMRLRIPTSEGTYLIPISEITRFEANSNYTYMHSVNRKPLLISKVLKAYDALLAPYGFIRTHQSHLVNKLHVRFIDKYGRIELIDASKVEVSRSRRKFVLDMLFTNSSEENLLALSS